MSVQTLALWVVVTWAVLLAVYLFSRQLFANRIVRRAPGIDIPDDLRSTTKPGTFFSKAGTLLVFMANITTCALVFVMALSPASQCGLRLIRINLPFAVNVVGGILFVIEHSWGLLAMIYNPHYTPLYKPLRQRFALAVHGPYAVVRHPRYAAEAFLNVALFLFTGIWVPLLGLLGWVAMYQQARAEERCLLAVAGDVYGPHYNRTGMFFPKWFRRSRRGE